MSAVVSDATGASPIGDIRRRVLRAYDADTWQDRVQRIFDACAEELDAPAAALYTLHLQSGALELDYRRGNAERFPESVDLISDIESQTGMARQIRRAADSGNIIEANGLVIISVHRKRTPLFVLVMASPRQASWEDIREALTPLRATYASRRVGRLVDRSRAHLNYRDSWDDFIAGLGNVILTSSGFRMAALREIHKSRLDCVAAWGFDQSPAYDELSWPLHKYETFRLAAEGEVQRVEDLRESAESSLRQIPGLEKVRGFIVVPVFAGTDIFGTLSFATWVRYDFAAAEESALQSLGNIVGLAMSYYRNPTGPSPSLSSLTSFSVRSQLEVIAASARHEGRGLIENAISYLAMLQDAKTLQATSGPIGRLEPIMLDLGIVLDKIRLAAKPPDYDWRKVSIRDLWTNVTRQFEGRLDTLSIKVRHPQTDASIYCYPDWVSSVFLQLILNSIDAFNRKGHGLRPPPGRDNRVLGLTIDAPADNRPITMRYWDNATGINPAMVESRPEDSELPLEQKLFRPRASSKRVEEGGWGLALARAALAEQRGSIRLIDNSIRGVTFEISLPNSQQNEEPQL